MYSNYIWAKVSYTIMKDDKVIKEFKNTACYSSLYDYYRKGNYMIIYNFECEKTKEYTLFYLQYISDMLKLESEFDNTYFKFKILPGLYKNMLVGSLIRFLFEKFQNIKDFPIHNELHKKLKYGKCKYRNKLARFCYFYSTIDMKNNYAHTGHSWKPSNTLIKYTSNFVKCNNIEGVNNFFTSRKDKYMK